jgi:hypothetical protein
MPAAAMKKSPSKQKLREIGAAVGSSRRVLRASTSARTAPKDRSLSTTGATRDIHQKLTSNASRIAITTTTSSSNITTPIVPLKSPMSNATAKALLVLTDPINSPKSTSVAHRKRQEQRHSRRVGSPRKKQTSPRKKKSLDQQQQKSISSSSSFDFNENSNYNGFTKEQLAHHEKEVNHLQLNLSRYTRVNDRDLVLRTIKDCRFLKCVPLVETCPAPPSYLVQEAWQTLEQRVQMSSITINGLLFMGSRTNQVIKVLRAMCQELCMGLKLSSGAVYKTLLWRLAQATQNHVVNQASGSSSSSASNDETFGELKTLLATSELVLQPVKKQPGQDTDWMIPSSTRLDTPPSLEVYATAGEIQAHVKSFRPYGLCRKVDVAAGKKQWILLHVTIQERLNLSTGASTRQARVEVGQQQQQVSSVLLPSASGAIAAAAY